MADLPNAQHHPGCPNAHRADQDRGCRRAPGAVHPTLHRRVQRWALRGVVIGVIGTVGSMACPNPAVALWLGGIFAVVEVPSVRLWLCLAIQPILRTALWGIDQATTPLPSPAAVAEARPPDIGPRRSRLTWEGPPLTDLGGL